MAWNFTQKRELAEGRNIPKPAFIEEFINAKETINQIRLKYGDEVKIFLVKKNFENNTVEKVVQIVPGESVDSYVSEKYNKSDLESIL